MSADADLLSYLLLDKPATVLLIEDRPSPLVESLGRREAGLQLQSASLAQLPPVLRETPRFDLVIMHKLRASTPANDLLAWLARIRDLHAKKFIVIDKPESAGEDNNAGPMLERADFFSLGFKLPPGSDTRPATSGMVVYEYAIRDYKTVPDWLNARFWANPQNWDKFRW
ncbi:MAG: hypothetical protein KDJ38_10835 [Gammaproteobacteria bacterium]|nr:hypothetical protein [Gammaproteobacteria bacterium]